MDKILGSGIITSILGYLVIGVDIAKQAITDGGMPSDLPGWLSFGGALTVGIILRLVPDPRWLASVYKKP